MRNFNHILGFLIWRLNLRYTERDSKSLPSLGQINLSFQFSSVQLLSHVQLFVTPWTVAHQASLSVTNSWSLLKLTTTELVMPSNHLILCRPLLPPSIFRSIRVCSSESVLRIRWPKYLWSFSFSISPYNEYLGLISFRMDWLYCLAVQGTLKSLLQYHSSKASILKQKKNKKKKHQFFSAQPSLWSSSHNMSFRSRVNA